MISATAILAPLLVEVGLTFALLFWGGAIRLQAIVKGGADRDAALRDAQAVPILGRLGDAARGELELPLLFYLLVILSQLTVTVSSFLVALFWLFVATRLALALIQLTTNDKGRRFMLHWGGTTVLALAWIVFAVGIVFGV